jgi:hypothetical protein
MVQPVSSDRMELLFAAAHESACALFGPDARARRCLFVAIKRTSLKKAPTTAFDPERTLAAVEGDTRLRLVNGFGVP